MRLHGKVTLLAYDKKKITKDIRDAAYKTILQAALHFLQEAAPAVPIDTGMARGSFLNLVQALRQRKITVNVDIPTKAQRVLKNPRSVDGLGRSNRLVYKHTNDKLYWKEPQSSKQLSTKPTDVFKQQNNVISFQYESRVRHLNYNDNKWQSFSRGHTAFFNYLEFQKIRPLSYVIQTTQTLGSQAPAGLSKFNIRSQKTVRN